MKWITLIMYVALGFIACMVRFAFLCKEYKNSGSLLSFDSWLEKNCENYFLDFFFTLVFWPLVVVIFLFFFLGKSVCKKIRKWYKID